MEYQLNSPEEKEEFAKQMVDYMARNKIKSPNTETYDQLYYQVLNQLKSKKNIKKINIQGMDGFQYKPVRKKAMYKEALFGFDDKERKSIALETLKGAGKGALYGGGVGTVGGTGLGIWSYLAGKKYLKQMAKKDSELQKWVDGTAGIKRQGRLGSVFKVLTNLLGAKKSPVSRNVVLTQLLAIPAIGSAIGAPIGAVKGMRDAMAYNQTV